MACNVIRDENNDITNVFLDNGKPSELYEYIDSVVENKKASYGMYLEILNEANRGNLNSLGNFVPLNMQGEPNHLLNPKLVSMITHAAANPGMYVDLVDQLEHEKRKDLLQESIVNFLTGINVDAEIVNNIHDKNNNKLDVAGQANMLTRLIKVSTDRSGQDTLAEEAAHFVTELLRADMNPLYTSMYKLIENYEEYNEMLEPNNFYFKQYEGNLDMLKREAIAKVISKHVLKNDTNLDRTEVDKKKISRLERWWEKVLNFLNKLLGRDSNPFTKSAELMLTNRLADVMSTNPNSIILEDTKFYQEKSNAPSLTPYDRVMADQELYGKKDVDVSDSSLYRLLSVDGALKIERYYNIRTREIIENRMSDKAALEYKKFQNEYFGYTEEQEAQFKVWSDLRQNSGNRVHKVMEELVNYYAGVSKKRPAEIEREFTEYGKFFKKLNAYAKKLVNDINTIQSEINRKNKTKDKAKIRTELTVINKASNSGGTVDLIAFFSDGSAAIYDYKSKIPRVDKAGARIDKNTGKVILEKDLWLGSAEMYNLQIGQYKKTLKDQYGVTQVRRSRVLPIMIDFQRDSNGMPMNVVRDLQLETDDSPFLQQLPLAKEKTGYESIDKLVESERLRLNLLLNEQKGAPYAQRRRLQKQIEASRRIIRDLQVDQKANSVILEANRTVDIILKGLDVENEFLENGEINPDYLSIQDLNKAYRDLIHFRNFTTIDQIIALTPAGNRRDVLEAALKDVKYKIDTALLGTNSIKEKMMERLLDLTNEQGIKGIDTFNRQIGKVTADWVSRSNQSHPALRFIHKTKSTIEANLVRIEKELANEIEEKSAALYEWGNNNGYPGASVYDLLINPKTMNLHPRFNMLFTEDRRKAYEKQDIKWLTSIMEVDEALLKKEYNTWKNNQIKLLREAGLPATKQARELAKWENRFNPYQKGSKKINNKAWLNPTNPFIKVTKDNNKLSKYLSADYMRIQQTPALKEFYDFHVQRTMEFLRLMGADKSYNFIANIHKDMVDEFLEGDWTFGNMKQSFLDMFQMREHNLSFGMTDLNGEFLRNVPRFHLIELTRWDPLTKREVMDTSLKSKELGKSLYLLGKASYMYRYLNELAPTMLMMETLYKDSNIRELNEDKTGKLSEDYLGEVIPTLKQTNVNTITEYINAEFFGRNLTTKDSQFGPGLSQNQTILALKNYHSIANLGLKGPVAMGALGAGWLGMGMQAAKGLYITKENLSFAKKAYFSRDPKLRALFEYFELTLEDMSKRRGDLLSSNMRAKFMTADRWYEFLARADRTIDAVLTVAMARNYGVDSKTGKLELLEDLPEGSKSLYDLIEVKENPK